MIRRLYRWLHPAIPTPCPECGQPITPSATDPHHIDCGLRGEDYMTVRRFSEFTGGAEIRTVYWGDGDE